MKTHGTSKKGTSYNIGLSETPLNKDDETIVGHHVFLTYIRKERKWCEKWSMLDSMGIEFMSRTEEEL